MNNSTLSFNQSPDLVKNSQSLFKLPVIFALVMVIGTMLLAIFQYMLSAQNGDKMYLLFLFNSLSNQIINYFFFYFSIAIVMFIVQKIHKITLGNLIIICIICIIFQMVNYLILLGYSQIYPLLQTEFELTYDEVSNLMLMFNSLVMILQPLILIGLIKLIGSIHKSERQAYNLPLGNHRVLFAILFTIIFLFPSMTILFTWFNSVIFYAFANYFDMFYNVPSLITLRLFVVIIMPAVLVLLCAVINFVIIFFSVKNCFVREVNVISLKLIFKAVGWSYLYLIIFGIAIGIIYMIASVAITSSLTHYYQQSLAMKLMLLLSLVIGVINIVATIIFTRKAVRKYF